MTNTCTYIFRVLSISIYIYYNIYIDSCHSLSNSTDIALLIDTLTTQLLLVSVPAYVGGGGCGCLAIIVLSIRKLYC